MAKQIIIELNKDGTVHIEAEGFTGKACEEATKSFIDALGADVKETRLKPEHSVVEQKVSNTVKNKG